MNKLLVRILLVLLLVLCALLSFLYIAPAVSSPAHHAQLVASLDEKTDNVLKLTATSALASAGISAIPGDTATPIAEKLADFTEYFMLILSVLYLEKYSLTIIGAGVFKILVPCICAALALSLFLPAGKQLRAFAAKLALFALAFFLIIPASVRLSDMIDGAYASSVSTTISQAEALTDETAALSEAADDVGLIDSILQRLSETTETLTAKAADTLNRFVETLAVMIVTSCAIPLLVLFFFLWAIKQITGLDLAVSVPHRRKTEAKP